MTYAETRSMGLHSHGTSYGERPRERLQRYLSRQYRGTFRTKALAEDIDATTKAAENILNGHWPNDRHLAAMVRRFGRDLLDAVFMPEIEPVLARLTEEERQLEEALEEVRQRRRQTAGRDEGPPTAVATTEGRVFSRKS